MSGITNIIYLIPALPFFGRTQPLLILHLEFVSESEIQFTLASEEIAKFFRKCNNLTPLTDVHQCNFRIEIYISSGRQIHLSFEKLIIQQCYNLNFERRQNLEGSRLATEKSEALNIKCKRRDMFCISVKSNFIKAKLHCLFKFYATIHLQTIYYLT